MSFLNRLYCGLFLVLFGTPLYAQNNFWKEVPEVNFKGGLQKRSIIPDRFRTIELDTTQIKNFLKKVPLEFTADAKNNPFIITIPMPDGLNQQFTLMETSMMEPALAAAFPEIKTYSGQGIEDPAAVIKVDWTSRGFHAMIFSPVSGSFAIDPYSNNTVTNYISYYKKDLPLKSFREELDPLSKKVSQSINLQQRMQAVCSGTSLRVFRLAVACTGEYAVAVNATTTSQALSAITTTINRVNGIYERDLSIRLSLVANNSKVVFTNPSTDPFTQNDNGTGLLSESQKVITDSIGTANYDIGHTFSTGAGGIAGLRVVCVSSAKARGVTGLEAPSGDAFDIDYVAHEIGHQFGGNHTFNAVTGNCSGGNRSSSSAVEPGSGSTIMAYAGICNTSNNLQNNSDGYFHSTSIGEILAYVQNTNCFTTISSGNSIPVVNAGSNYTIPISTPFILTGSATDANGDALTYNWEQIDLGPEGNWNTPSGNAPIFRSFNPTTSPSRYFPRITDLVNNTVTIGEVLPSYARNLQFRLTARDNRVGGGGQCSSEMNITVVNNGGAFTVSNPNTATTWDVGDFKTITWNVANTNIAPVNCANVSIRLSTDGGVTFPIILLASTPNDGSEEIQVPNNLTSSARIGVMAVNNIFFDISNANFTIRNAPAPNFVFNNPAPVLECSSTNATSTLKTGSLGGYNTPINLSASGNPAGTAVIFNVNPVTPSSEVQITLQGTAAPGIYNVTLTGVSGSITKTRIVQFRLGVPELAPVLLQPANNTAGVSLNPQFTWQAVTGASGYNLLISSSSSFTDTVQSITGLTSTSHLLANPLADDRRYYWRMAATNSCGAGPATTALSFITVGKVCGDTIYSSNVPITIPATISTVNSSIVIPSGNIITDVDVVGLKGSHTKVGDLSVTVMSPGGIIVSLFSTVCNTDQGFYLNFDDQAAAGAINCPPTGGQVRRPAQPLSAFNNQSSTGSWTLSVKDNVAGNGGTLEAWGIKICVYSTVYTFTGNGNWSDAANWKNNSMPPAVLPAGHFIVIDPVAGSCIGNVPVTILNGGHFIVKPGKTFELESNLIML